MVEDPVQHGSCKHWIPHHLCPVNNLLIGGKDDGAGFIGVADKGKKAVRLSTAEMSRKAFWSDNLPVPEVLSRDWIFRQ